MRLFVNLCGCFCVCLLPFWQASVSPFDLLPSKPLAPPSDVTEEDVLQLFPGAEAADLLYKGRAVVFFSTPAEAQAAVGGAALRGIRGQPTGCVVQTDSRRSRRAPPPDTI